MSAETEQARTRAREVHGQADAAWARHIRELWDLTTRAETAESDAGIQRDHVFELVADLERAKDTSSEVGEILANAVKELSAAQQELLLKDIEIRRLRAELQAGPVEGQTLTVLLHHGEPHTIYASREDAHADTATHGMPADAVWQRCDERPAAAFTWRCEAFIYNPASNGFRRARMPAARPGQGAA
ncbi:hypothetical protein GCM10010260_16840 [Streptomyces filipinensis]|uniref:Uncharacterized protein n=1 Tax=Streptomyces filipinensis TaxID=66887 RepID=A0A918I7R2_9ACTN|nr:hypothetical protein [Streptomyces filipinensis]GGU84416.1 hypothetical protein GCM10010260_16840 [Streptomyces filipinensis]